MNERVKKVRKNLNLNQGEFANKLGLSSKGTISAIENGERSVTERLIMQLSREFNVNEQWLRSGEGEMFNPKDTSILEALCEEHSIKGYARNFLEMYLEIDEKEREHFENLVKAMVNVRMRRAPSPDERPAKKEQAANEYCVTLSIDEKVDLYRQRLLDEEKGREWSTTSENTEDTDSIIA